MNASPLPSPSPRAIGLLTRGRALTPGGLLALCALAWTYLIVEAADMAEMSSMMDVGGMDSAWTVGEWGYLTVMMVAMMLPSAAPPILLVARIGDILE